MNLLRHYRAQARLAWHVFRGRPLAYRFQLGPGSGPMDRDGLVSLCVYRPAEPVRFVAVEESDEEAW